MKVKAPANAMIGLLERHPRTNQARARQVIEDWFEPTINLDDDQEYERWANRLNASIAKNLDAQSLTEFIGLILEDRDKHIRTQLAKKGASVKLANDKDGKQANKTTVRECWDDWQNQPTRYGGNAAFARDMLDKYQSLRSQAVIERWCREWKAQNVTQPAQ